MAEVSQVTSPDDKTNSSESVAWTIIAGVLLCAIALLHPWRISVNISEILPRAGFLPASAATAIALTPADLLIWLTTLVFVIHFLFSRRVSALGALPAPSLLIVLCMALSLIPALRFPVSQEAPRPLVDTMGGLKETIQTFEYLVVVVMLFTLGLRREGAVLAVVVALFLGATLVLIRAGAQYLDTTLPAMQVSGGMGNRNALGAYLCVLLPFLFGVGLKARSKLWFFWALGLVIAGLVVMLAGGLLLALCVGLLVVCFLHRPWLLPLAGLGLLLLVVLLLPARFLPRRNAELLHESIQLYRPTDRAGSFINKLAPKKLEDIAAETQAKLKALDLLAARRDPVPPNEIPTLSLAELSWPWQQRYKDWQAAINMMRAHPLLGVGAGGYRANFNAFYAGMPKMNKDLMEDDGHSLYMVLGATAGVPALIFLFWLFAAFFRRAVITVNYEEKPEGMWYGVALGGAGALAAVAVGAFYSEFLIRSVGISLGIALGLIAAAYRYISDQAREEKAVMRILTE